MDGNLELDSIDRRARALYEALYSREPKLSNYETDYLLRGAIPRLTARIRELEANAAAARQAYTALERENFDLQTSADESLCPICHAEAGDLVEHLIEHHAGLLDARLRQRYGALREFQL